MLHIALVWASTLLGSVAPRPPDTGPPPSTVAEIADALRTGKLARDATGEGVVVWPEPFLVDAATTPDGARDELIVLRGECLILLYRRDDRLYAACVYADRDWREPDEEWPIFDRDLFDEHVRLRLDRQQAAGASTDAKGSAVGKGEPPAIIDTRSDPDTLGLKQRLERALLETLAEKLQVKVLPHATPFDEIVLALREGRMKQGPESENEAVVNWSDHPMLADGTTDSSGASHGSRVEGTFRRYLFFYSSRAEGQESTDDSAFLLDQDLEPHEEWFYYDPQQMAAHVHAVQERIRNIPAVPCGVAAADNFDGSVTITWVDNSGNEESFEVLRERCRFGTWGWDGTWHFEVDENVTAFTDDTGVLGKYRYRVRATNDSGASAASDPVVVTVKTPK